MTYAIGEDIVAADYNAFASALNSVYGLGSGDYGYGQTDTPLISVGNDVSSLEWVWLRDRIALAATHQGTAVNLPSVTDLETGDDVLCYDGSLGRPDIPQAIADIAFNRHEIAVGQFNTVAQAIASTRTTAWNSQVRHIFTVTFADQDAARHFFNSGGLINISGERTGGTLSSQNTDWSALLGSIVPFGRTDYFALTTSNVQFATTAGSAYNYAYAANDWTIFVKTNTVTDPSGRGGKGEVITFEVQFNDDHTGINDSVDGTLKSIVGYRITSGAVSGVIPTFNTLTELTAGS